jgi:hypothetical protein
MVLGDFLTFLGGVGAIVAISWLWEYFNWWPNMTPDRKKLVLFGFSALVAVVALVVKTYVPANVLEMIAPYFLMVSTIFGYLFTGAAFHKVTK